MKINYKNTLKTTPRSDINVTYHISIEINLVRARKSSIIKVLQEWEGFDF